VLCVTSAREGSTLDLARGADAGDVFLYRTGVQGLPESEYRYDASVRGQNLTYSVATVSAPQSSLCLYGGNRCPSRPIVPQYGASRSVVREAVKMLTARVSWDPAAAGHVGAAGNELESARPDVLGWLLERNSQHRCSSSSPSCALPSSLCGGARGPRGGSREKRPSQRDRTDQAADAATETRGPISPFHEPCCAPSRIDFMRNSPDLPQLHCVSASA